MPILKTNWCCAMFAGLALTTAAAAAERTAFSVRTYLEYDDNVTLVADEAVAAAPVKSAGAGVMLNVGRTLVRAHGYELRGSITGFHTEQFDGDAEDYSVSAIVPRLALSKRGSVGGRSTQFSAGLTVRRDWLGSDGYSLLTDLSASWLINVGRNWSIGPSYTVSLRDYYDQGFDPAVTSRDALRHTLGISSQFGLPSPAGERAPGRLTFSASAQRNDADGRDYEFDGALFSAVLDLPLRAPRRDNTFSDIGLQIGITALDTDYDEFVPAPKRSDRRITGSIAMSVTVPKLGRFDLSFTRLDFDSNRPEFVASRNLARFGLTHSF